MNVRERKERQELRTYDAGGTLVATEVYYAPEWMDSIQPLLMEPGATGARMSLGVRRVTFRRFHREGWLRWMRQWRAGEVEIHCDGQGRFTEWHAKDYNENGELRGRRGVSLEYVDGQPHRRRQYSVDNENP